MDYLSELLPPDKEVEKIGQQADLIHSVISGYLEKPASSQIFLEFYLLKTFRDTSFFVHDESSPEAELQALTDYLHIRGSCIQEFLVITNTGFLKAGNDA